VSRSSDAAGGPSLYDRLGGKAAVAAAVDRFYERLLADPDLRLFFAQANLSRLRKRQGQFFAQALGGPAGYKGPGM
jgi:hemoglobin